MRSPQICLGMTIGLAAAVALEAERSSSRSQHDELRKQRDRRHTPEGNRKERRAAQAIYRRATKHDR